MLNAKEFVDAKLYDSEESVIQEALRSLLQVKPHLRVALAVNRYQREPISVAKAAALAGVSFDRMKEILDERGLPLRLGAEDEAEALEELISARRMLS